MSLSRVFRRCIAHMSPPLPPLPTLSSLRGTAQPHNAYILLHAPTNQPPSTFPPRGPESQVHRRLQLAAHKWGGIVNWVWHPPATLPSPPCSIPSPNCCMTETTTADNDEAEHDDYYSATVFSKNGRLDVPHLALSNMDQVEETIRQFAVVDVDVAGNDSPDEIHVLVCTHAARDCRCGVRGGAFCRAVHDQIAQRGSFLGEDGAKVRLRLCQVGHVGGHQYAPNVLIYPFGDWYGGLAPEQVSGILDELNIVVGEGGGSVRPLGKTERPLLTSVEDHWRGRMGMSKEEQASLAQSLGLGQRREDGDNDIK